MHRNFIPLAAAKSSAAGSGWRFVHMFDTSILYRYSHRPIRQESFVCLKFAARHIFQTLPASTNSQDFEDPRGQHGSAAIGRGGHIEEPFFRRHRRA
jgi:hypothetical protein